MHAQEGRSMDVAGRKDEAHDAYGFFLPEAREAGLQLRAVRAAQRLLIRYGRTLKSDTQRFNSWEDEDSAPSDPRELLKRFINEQWEDEMAILENGFRQDDSSLSSEDVFRDAVVRNLVQLVHRNFEVQSSGPGLPQTSLEGEATNRLVEAVAKTLRDRIRAVESEALRPEGRSFFSKF